MTSFCTSCGGADMTSVCHGAMHVQRALYDTPMLWSTPCHAVVKHPRAVTGHAAGPSRRHAATVLHAQAGSKTAEAQADVAETYLAAAAAAGVGRPP